CRLSFLPICEITWRFPSLGTAFVDRSQSQTQTVQGLLQHARKGCVDSWASYPFNTRSLAMRGLPGLSPSRVGSAALLGALLLGVAAWAIAAEPQRGGTLKFIPHADLKVLDPIWTTAYISRNHGYMVYDVLFALDAQLHVQPQMVDTWEVSSDGMHYTFSLRQGLKVHDGTPGAAEDAVASLRRWGQKDALGKQLMRATAQLAAVDNTTLRLDLQEPFTLVLDALAKPSTNVPCRTW